MAVGFGTLVRRGYGEPFTPPPREATSKCGVATVHATPKRSVSTAARHMPNSRLAFDAERPEHPLRARLASPRSFIEHLRAASMAQAEGDDRALDDFLRRIERPLRKYLTARLEDAPDVPDAIDDVVQDALWKVMNGLEACRATSDLQAWAWIWTVVARVRLDHLRRESHRRRTVPIDGVVGRRLRALDDEYLHAIDVSSGDRVLIACLMRSYDELPPSSAALVWGRVILSMSDAELERELGTSASAVKRRWQRLQARLRRETWARLDNLEDATNRHLGLAALRARRLGRSMLAPHSPMPDE
jgi:RNA polymerase sigma factor (sigma-70 family)